MHDRLLHGLTLFRPMFVIALVVTFAVIVAVVEA
jgi:hypothetical protein